jgi:hypothetical protein
MFTGSGRAVVRVVDMQPTDSVVELACQARQSSRWHSEQRLNLVGSQLNSELETGAGRVPKEIPPEPGICQQPTERPFDVSLTHASSPLARIAPSVFPQSVRMFGAASHLNV